MKMKGKKLSALVLSAVLLTGAAAGCGEKTDNSPNFLEVYMWEAGYGSEWFRQELKAFAEESWVKEKYPNFKWDLKANDQQGYASGRLSAGSSNSIDLFLAPDLKNSESLVLDLTDIVYEQEVPGETGVKYKDKLLDYMLDPLSSIDESGNRKYYAASSSAGMVGYLYNVTLFEELGLEVPNTTEELFALCEEVKNFKGEKRANYQYTYTFKSSKVPYGNRMEYLYWAQYEGVQGVKDFYNAIAYDEDGELLRNTTKIFESPGRLYSCEVFEKLFKESSGYYDRGSAEDEFMQGQTKFLQGQGLIMPCGEWFSFEMQDLAKGYIEAGYDFEIGMMKTPILSKIVEKTPSIQALGETEEDIDAVLSKVVAAIDAGETSYEGVDNEDFAKIKDARSIIVCPDAINSNIVIPKNATAKDVAVDFIRFLATDKAQSIVAKYTVGGMMPFEFDLESDDKDLYSELSTNYANTFRVQNDVAKILKSSNTQTPSVANGTYALVKYANFGPWRLGGWETLFAQDSTLTAAKIINERTNDYWLEDNAARFKKALKDAGLN